MKTVARESKGGETRPFCSSDLLPFNSSVLEGRFVWGKPDDPPEVAGSLWILVCRDGVVVESATGNPLVADDACLSSVQIIVGPLSLGTLDGRRLLAATIDSPPASPVYGIEPFNARRDVLAPDLLTLSGIAASVLSFDRGSRYCGTCGSGMLWISGEWGKRCMSCGAVRYPASSPCAIVLVYRGDEILLVRKPGWPEGRYSLVAGFLSPGESLEECARREVLEETGIVIDDPTYVASQYWPFPSQIMTGFSAAYLSGDISCGDDELEDARWFPLHALPSGLPGRRSIARMMIDSHCAGVRCGLRRDSF